MATLCLLLVAFFAVGRANAMPQVQTMPFEFAGQRLPQIRHMDEIKCLHDTLFFVYESEEGFGQRFLRRATIDRMSHRLVVGPEIGKQDDGYYVAYMPYPCIGTDGKMRVVGQDDGEVYNLNDSLLARTKTYLFDATVPFPISQYAQDIHSISSHRYIFIGREPKGGAQYVMTADMDSGRINVIRKICISPDLTAWMPNAGKMVYSSKHNRMAFAYRLHPTIEISGLDGTEIKTITTGPTTFDSATLEKADFEDLNTIHFIDVAASDDYIYALYRGAKQGETGDTMIYQLDWDGNTIMKYNIDGEISRISVLAHDTLIAWDGKGFTAITIASRES